MCIPTQIELKPVKMVQIGPESAVPVLGEPAGRVGAAHEQVDERRPAFFARAPPYDQRREVVQHGVPRAERGGPAVHEQHHDRGARRRQRRQQRELPEDGKWPLKRQNQHDIGPF